MTERLCSNWWHCNSALEVCVRYLYHVCSSSYWAEWLSIEWRS